MADRKITDLTALAAGSQATGDLLTIVDVSEGAAADKNKKITVESLFKGIPSNVGIGTSSPSNLLHLNSSDTAAIRFDRGGSKQLNIGTDSGQSFVASFESKPLAFATSASSAYTERMRIDSSGNVGIGTSSPVLSIGSVSGKVLHTAGAGTTGARFQNTSGTSIEFFAGSDAVINTGTSTNMAFKINDSEKMRIDSSGNVGIGIGNPSSYYQHGDNLVVGATGANSGITIRTGNVNQGILAFADGTTGGSQQYAGYVIYDHNVNDMLFAADATERMRIKSDGDIKFGNQTASTSNSSTALVHIDAGLEYWSGTAGDYRALKHRLYYTGTDDAYGMGVSASLLEIQSQSAIAFFAGSAGVASGRRAERVRILSSGGITFNGDTAAANALDDYEEGTWTPTLSAGGTITNLLNAAYTKVGRLVTVSFYYSGATLGTSTSEFRVGGLPFIVKEGYGFGNLAYSAGTNVDPWRPLFSLNNTFIYFHRVDGSGATQLNSQASTVLLGGGTYMTDS